jgi:hypothetical protein
LGFELVFVVLFIVETRGRTLEETAALFDGENKLGGLVQTGKDATIISPLSRSTSDGEHDIDYIYPGKRGALDSYGLRRPELVLDRDQIGYARSGGVFSYAERV